MWSCAEVNPGELTPYISVLSQVQFSVGWGLIMVACCAGSISHSSRVLALAKGNTFPTRAAALSWAFFVCNIIINFPLREKSVSAHFRKDSGGVVICFVVSLNGGVWETRPSGPQSSLLTRLPVSIVRISLWKWCHQACFCWTSRTEHFSCCFFLPLLFVLLFRLVLYFVFCLCLLMLKKSSPSLSSFES